MLYRYSSARGYRIRKRGRWPAAADRSARFGLWQRAALCRLLCACLTPTDCLCRLDGMLPTDGLNTAVYKQIVHFNNKMDLRSVLGEAWWPVGPIPTDDVLCVRTPPAEADATEAALARHLESLGFSDDMIAQAFSRHPEDPMKAAAWLLDSTSPEVNASGRID